jgi:hypothetical protein
VALVWPWIATTTDRSFSNMPHFLAESLGQDIVEKHNFVGLAVVSHSSAQAHRGRDSDSHHLDHHQN